MLLIVCLGNPGREYAKTRHNAGFRVAEALAERHRISLSRHRLRCLYGKGTLAGQDIVIAEPMTFMNLSGEAARNVQDFYKIPLENVAAVHDETALPLGSLRLRPGGSDAGHKGVRSLIQHFGSQDFTRVRLGVGAPPAGWDIKDWVLSDFARNEADAVDDMVARACEAVACWVRNGIDAAMTQYNN